MRSRAGYCAETRSKDPGGSACLGQPGVHPADRYAGVAGVPCRPRKRHARDLDGGDLPAGTCEPHGVGTFAGPDVEHPPRREPGDPGLECTVGLAAPQPLLIGVPLVPPGLNAGIAEVSVGGQRSTGPERGRRVVVSHLPIVAISPPSRQFRLCRVASRPKVTHIEQLPAWEIRPLGADEVDVVGDVLGLARLNQGDGFYLVAWAADVPLGHVHLALAQPAELQDMAVRPSHRRRGVGTALVRAAEHEARARGFDEVRLEVSVDDLAAQTFYRKSGYRDAGLPIRRVKGRIELRTGPLEVDDNLRSLVKRWG